MNSLTAQELLRDYAEHRSESAFTELVRRHVDLVYSAAFRMTGESHSAQDVTQAVFVALAENAARLAHHPVLSGWLHTTARNLAANHVRAAMRRQENEQKAAAMNALLSDAPDVSWQQIATHLDAALGELDDADRDAVLLRYFEKKTAREIALILGVSDEAAQKRVSRAVERLREFFAKRNVTIGASGLTVLISANAVQSAPAALLASILATVLTGKIVSTSTAVAATSKSIARTTLQKTLVTATVAVLVGAGLVAARFATRSGHNKIIENVAQSAVAGTVEPGEQPISQQPVSPAAVYSIENISVPASFDSIHVSGFNNRGQAVGALAGSNGVLHAFVWDNGKVADLGTFGGSKAIACSINDLGEIAAIVLTNEQRRLYFLQTNGVTDLGVIDGFAKLGPEGNTFFAPSVSVNNRSEVTCRLTMEDGNQRSFIFRDGRISYFGLRGDGNIADTRAMNDQGDIAGVSIPSKEGWGVFLWHEGTVTDLKTLGGPRAGANAVNDHGTIVGWANPADAAWDQAHAIVWKNGELRDLNAGDWKNSRATGINNTGDIVGWATTSSNRTLAFLKRGEKVSDLNDLIPPDSGWRIVGASEINERGQILAQARKDGQSLTVILSPPKLQPSPVTLPVAVAPSNTISSASAQTAITGFERLPDGAFRLRFSVPPGVKYNIEASTNLTAWVVIGEAVNRGGQLEFTDLDAPKFPLRFYRVAHP